MTDDTERAGWPRWQGAAVRIIVVDDARLIHEALQAILRRTSSFVISGFARSLTEGARQVSRHRPDMVICEIAIDGESALELCRWVHRTAPLTRVVVLSHRDDMSLAKAAFEAGASAYLLKTVPPDELVQRLCDVMGGLNIRRHLVQGLRRSHDEQRQVQGRAAAPPDRARLHAEAHRRLRTVLHDPVHDGADRAPAAVDARGGHQPRDGLPRRSTRRTYARRAAQRTGVSGDRTRHETEPAMKAGSSSTLVRRADRSG